MVRTARISAFIVGVAVCATLAPFSSIPALAAPTPQSTVHSAPNAPSLGQPNVVMLLLDDYAAMDERVFEQLPNIKATFMDQGINFTNYWANFSLCCPGRAALLTGQRDDHNGVMKNEATLFDPNATVATALQGVGYYTGIIGKYFNHSNLLASKTPPGWDYVSIKGDPAYYDYTVWTNGVAETHGSTDADYSADVMSQKSSAFFDSIPADKPVFAWLAPNAPHAGPDADGITVPGQPVPPSRFIGDPRCADLPPYRPASYDVLNTGPQPRYETKLPPMTDPDGWDLTPTCESLLAVDEWLGNVIAALQADGRYDNTIFILSSDNGMGWGAHRVPGKIAPYTAQMPLYISWPAVIGPTVQQNSTLITNVDVAPTLCEIAGCALGPFDDGFGVDGQSFAGLLDPAHFTSVPNRDSIVIEGVGGGVPFFEAILTGANNPLGQWLFVHYSPGRRELYDMSGGPCWSWAQGDPGDPCMLNNVTLLKPNLRRKVSQELTLEWGASPVTLSHHPWAGIPNGPGSE